MKVLWFSNVAFSDKKPNSTGTWLYTMASALLKTESIQLFNISQANVNKTIRQDSQVINQWLVPYESLKKNGLPSSQTIQEIINIIADIKPDIIHIWGIENYWGLLSARGIIKGKIILEIQGLKFECQKYIYAGLSFFDILKCFGIKEFLKPWGSLMGLKYSFKRWGKFEKEILLGHSNISTQSDWVRAYVKSVNPKAQIFNTSISLRKEFIESPKWEKINCVSHQIFTSTSSVMPYKGLHILIDAIGVLKKKYPKIKLVIAGSYQSGIRRDGYTKWLIRKIKLLNLEENIDWVGPLDAENIVLLLLKSNVAVIPSFIETYCLALNEALAIGIPTVVSFSGAMPELAIHEKSAIFFPPGDAIMCAFAIEKLLDDNNYAIKISQKAYSFNKLKNNINIADIQMTNYFRLLHNN